MASTKELGLILSGGGARGAYQAGSLKALQEIHKAAQIPFANIIGGVSAGAINAVYMASQIDQPELACEKICKTWSEIYAEQVFRTDYPSVTRNALKLVRGLSLGGISSSMRTTRIGLLNTSPLEELIREGVDFDKIQQLIDAKKLKGLTLSATDYSTAFGVTFVQGQPGIEMWANANRFSLPAKITAEHVMASSAIPIFFPPIEVDKRFYGDGCLRNTAPLSPAVHLGADKIFVIGVRNRKHIEDFKKPSVTPSMGRVLSVIINAIFMDSTEVDLERLQNVNESIEKYNLDRKGSGYKTISTFYVHPSKDLGQIAQSRWSELPGVIRFLFNGLGTAEESADLLSYLLFEPSYCSSLIELGYEDTMKQRAEVLRFLEE